MVVDLAVRRVVRFEPGIGDPTTGDREGVHLEGVFLAGYARIAVHWRRLVQEGGYKSGVGGCSGIGGRKENGDSLVTEDVYSD